MPALLVEPLELPALPTGGAPPLPELDEPPLPAMAPPLPPVPFCGDDWSLHATHKPAKTGRSAKFFIVTRLPEAKIDAPPNRDEDRSFQRSREPRGKSRIC
jgi:hypothetical protein